MKLLEIRNNLAKLSYEEDESPIIGSFVSISNEEKSYVGQFVNLKSDGRNNFGIAKLVFVYNSEGVVEDYDGSIPRIDSELAYLHPSEILDLFPSADPIKIGVLAQTEETLNLDISAFEKNLTVFASKNYDAVRFISNSVIQLFLNKKKSVIVDFDNSFDGYKKIVFTKDFKVPLTPSLIDFIFDYELTDVEAETKAVIQNIFYDVSEYIKTLEYPFLPIDSFVDVVSAQYKQTEMPELALLKNKLLKYRDNNVFANTKEEFLIFKDKIQERNLSIVDLSVVEEPLQNEVLQFIHSLLETIDKYIYFFVKLNNYNSNKKILKSLINNNHVYTTIITDPSYKYVSELKTCANNMILFNPQETEHEFSFYSTFLNKLNKDEAIVCGELTHEIPFVVDISTLELPLTQEDVFGDRYRFVPVEENLGFIRTEDGAAVVFESPEKSDASLQIESQQANSVAAQKDEEEFTDFSALKTVEPVKSDIEAKPEGDVLQDFDNITQDKSETMHSDIFEDSTQEDLSSNNVYLDDFVNQPSSESNQNVENSDLIDVSEPEIVSDSEEISFGDDENDIILDENENIVSELTEDDLDFIESTEESSDVSESENLIGGDEKKDTPVVPVFPAEDDLNNEDFSDYKQGDMVTHPRYGRGVIEKIIKYGNKILCSISFDNVGRRLLDPSVSEFEKVS